MDCLYSTTCMDCPFVSVSMDCCYSSPRMDCRHFSPCMDCCNFSPCMDCCHFTSNQSSIMDANDACSKMEHAHCPTLLGRCTPTCRLESSKNSRLGSFGHSSALGLERCCGSSILVAGAALPSHLERGQHPAALESPAQPLLECTGGDRQRRHTANFGTW